MINKIGDTVDDIEFTIPKLISYMEELEGKGWRGMDGKKRYAKYQAYQQCLLVLRGEKPHRDITKAGNIDFLKTPTITADKQSIRRAMMTTYLSVIRSFNNKSDFKPRYTTNPVLGNALTVGSRVDFNVVDKEINPNYRVLRGKVLKRTPHGIIVKVGEREIELHDKMTFREFKSYSQAS